MIFFYYKTDLRRRILKVSIIGGFSSFIAEYWYLKDYWKPPTIIGNAVISVEDFLVGFFIYGISVSVYNFVFKKYEPEENSEKKTEKQQPTKQRTYHKTQNIEYC
jgi:hypothetical protein